MSLFADANTYLDDECTASKRIDLSMHDHRVWLTKHIIWCVHHGHSVEIDPVLAVPQPEHRS